MSSSEKKHEFKVPDFDVMNKVRTDIRMLVSKKTHSQAGDVKNNLAAVYHSLDHVDGLLRNLVGRGYVNLESLNVAQSLDEIAALRSATPINPGRTDALISSLEDELMQEALIWRSAFDNNRAELFDENKVLEDYESINVEERKDQLQKHLAELKGRTIECQKKLDKFKADTDNLEAIILATKSPALSDIFKNIIPSQSAINAAIKIKTLRKPDLDLIVGMASALRNMVGSITEGLSFSAVAKEYDKTLRGYDNTKAELKQLQVDNEKSAAELADLACVPQVKPLLKKWTAEMRVLEIEFSKALSPLAGTPSFDLLCNGLLALTGYVTDLRNSYYGSNPL